jgi:hypothetical protein
VVSTGFITATPLLMIFGKSTSVRKSQERANVNGRISTLAKQGQELHSHVYANSYRQNHCSKARPNFEVGRRLTWQAGKSNNFVTFLVRTVG